MIRIVLIPNQQRISLTIPKNYVGRKIEVIAFAIDEGMQERSHSPKKVSFNALSIDTRGYKFNRNEANER